VGFATIPFAPLAIGGFEAWLLDGTPRGRARAASVGCLEGALFSVITGVLHLLIPKIAGDRFVNSECYQSGECWEGNPQVMMIHWPAAASYGLVSVGLLAAGLVLTGVSRGDGLPDPAAVRSGVALRVAPLTLRDGGGAMIWSRW